MQQEIDANQAAARVVNKVIRVGRFAECTLGNGIVLNLKPVPPLLLQAVNAEFKTPEPPVVFMEEKGRNEPNPNDPAYEKELEELAEAQDLAINNVILATGTSVKFVPEGYFKPEEDGWLATVDYVIKLSGKDIPFNREDPTERYLAWLRFYAIETGVDLALVQGLPMNLAGIREGEIDEVLESFRGVPERREDIASLIEAGSENGDTDNRAGRRRRR